MSEGQGAMFGKKKKQDLKSFAAALSARLR